ncbi:tyrosine-type recombinase/integrase [Labedella populi]|uniref:tyrosine-type recombinase/integrase n=1 Tax=Labedella populi TaxID=2498850 RepID=UPI0024364D7C|nr:tyrosine-type recombinase/integrase [Labedella populi]
MLIFCRQPSRTPPSGREAATARNESREARDESVRLATEANEAFRRQAVAQERANALKEAELASPTWSAPRHVSGDLYSVINSSGRTIFIDSLDVEPDEAVKLCALAVRRTGSTRQAIPSTSWRLVALVFAPASSPFHGASSTIRSSPCRSGSFSCDEHRNAPEPEKRVGGVFGLVVPASTSNCAVNDEYLHVLARPRVASSSWRSPDPPSSCSLLFRVLASAERTELRITAQRMLNQTMSPINTMAKVSGLEPMTPHDLRHTTASLAVSSGANVKAVQRMLGHASAAMTLDTYADLFDDDLDAVATALDQAARSAVVATALPRTPGDRVSPA